MSPITDPEAKYRVWWVGKNKRFEPVEGFGQTDGSTENMNVTVSAQTLSASYVRSKSPLYAVYPKHVAGECMRNPLGARPY